MSIKQVLCIAAVFGAVSTPITAGGHEGPYARAIKARQAPMTLMAYNLGILGGMAKGQVDYDAAVAGQAASNIAAAAAIVQPSAWPEDSDNGFAEGTDALPAIWENMDDFMAKQTSLIEVTAALSGVAADGLDPMRAALGDVGKACGSCHKQYRQDDN